MASGVEIENKYLVHEIPFSLEGFETKEIAQYYLSTEPVLRIRKSNDRYILTFKGQGLLEREEHEFPYTEEAFERLKSAALGYIIEKTRYIIPYGEYKIELDVFHGEYDGLVLAEVEFDSRQEAESFVPPEWFGEDVTMSGKYQNSRLALGGGC